MDIYKLYRNFWDFSFNNPEKIKPNHVAVYSFSIEHCNRLGWKEKFGFPTSMVLDATGIKSYSVYKKTFDDLVSFGFIHVVEYSKNQYSSNIIALKENCKANCKALDKAITKHVSKQSESTYQSTYQSIDSIDKQLYNSTNIPKDYIAQNLLIPEMKKTFIKNFPNAFIDENDLPALLEIAKKIFKWLNLHGNFLEHKEQILENFETIVTHCKADSHLQKYSISQISKNFSSVIQSLKSNGINNKKHSTTTKLGTSDARIAAITNW